MGLKVYYLWQKPHRKNYSGYDAVTDMVVLAFDAAEARRLAAKEALAEGEETWLDTKRSGCEQAKRSTGGKPRVLVASCVAG
jgi:hypothetical protein